MSEDIIIGTSHEALAWGRSFRQFLSTESERALPQTSNETYHQRWKCFDKTDRAGNLFTLGMTTKHSNNFPSCLFDNFCTCFAKKNSKRINLLEFMCATRNLKGSKRFLPVWHCFVRFCSFRNDNWTLCSCNFWSRFDWEMFFDNVKVYGSEYSPASGTWCWIDILCASPSCTASLDV